MKYQFSNKEKENICVLFENGAVLKEIAKIFGCSGGPIIKSLIITLGEEKYIKIAKEHRQEANRKNIIKRNKSEKGRKTSAELARKMGQNGQTREKKLKISNKEIIFLWKEKGWSHRKIAQKAGCAHRKIGRLLISDLDEDEYNKIAQKHRQKACQKNAQKMGRLPKTEKQLKNFISSWEDKFYDEYLEPIFGYDLQRQYYIKEINHRADFAILDSKILIEIDGDYYHNMEGRKERDVQIDEWAKRNGWKIYRYCDEDLKKLGVLKR